MYTGRRLGHLDPDARAVEILEFFGSGFSYKLVVENVPAQVISVFSTVATRRAVELLLDFGVVIGSLDAVAAVFHESVHS